jgi:hypothetical protein
MWRLWPATASVTVKPKATDHSVTHAIYSKWEITVDGQCRKPVRIRVRGL